MVPDVLSDGCGPRYEDDPADDDVEDAEGEAVDRIVEPRGVERAELRGEDGEDDEVLHDDGEEEERLENRGWGSVEGGREYECVWEYVESVRSM